MHHERVVVTSRECPPLLESRPRGADEHEGKVAQALEQPFDQIEHEVVGPVQVGEREHERAPSARDLRGTPRPSASRRRGRVRVRPRAGRSLPGCRATPRRPARSPTRLEPVEHGRDGESDPVATIGEIAGPVAVAHYLDRFCYGCPHVRVPVGRVLCPLSTNVVRGLGALGELEHETGFCRRPRRRAGVPAAPPPPTQR